MQMFLKKPENETFAESLRHVAIELVETCNLHDMAELVRQRAIHLRTLSIVFPSTDSSTPSTARFLPPEEYRVLDDDNHLYTRREVKAMFKKANAAMGLNIDNRLL